MVRTRSRATVVALDEIVGANLLKFRKDRKPRLTREALIEAMRDYGVSLAGASNAPDTLIALEKGTRSMKVGELLAFSRFFGVPPWAFLVPPAEMVQAEIEMGGDRIFAIDVILDMFNPADAWGVQWDVEAHLNALATETAIEQRDPEGARFLLDRVREAYGR